MEREKVLIIKYMFWLLLAIWLQLCILGMVFMHSFCKWEIVNYPEQQVYLSSRYRGCIVLICDLDGEERCVACNLCAVVCLVDCILLQKGEQEDGRWYSEFFRINFFCCIFCGMCEEVCLMSAIQLTLDFEMGEYDCQ